MMCLGYKEPSRFPWLDIQVSFFVSTHCWVGLLGVFVRLLPSEFPRDGPNETNRCGNHATGLHAPWSRQDGIELQRAIVSERVDAELQENWLPCKGLSFTWGLGCY